MTKSLAQREQEIITNLLEAIKDVEDELVDHSIVKNGITDLAQHRIMKLVAEIKAELK